MSHLTYRIEWKRARDIYEIEEAVEVETSEELDTYIDLEDRPGHEFWGARLTHVDGKPYPSRESSQ